MKTQVPLRCRWSALAALIAVVTCATMSAAAEFSADLVATQGGSTITGKFYVKGTKARQELVVAGAKTVMILLSDKKVAWFINPDKKTYLEIRGNVPDLAMLAEPKVPANVGTRKLVGKEKVNGYLCDKYALVFKDKRQGTVYQWVSPKLKVPLKTEQRVGGKSSVMELKNVKEGKVPSALFQVPAGYKKLEMPGVRGGPGASGGKPRPTAPK